MGMRRWTTPRTVAPRFITYLTLFSVRIAIAYLILAARPTPMACGSRGSAFNLAFNSALSLPALPEEVSAQWRRSQ